MVRVSTRLIGVQIEGVDCETMQNFYMYIISGRAINQMYEKD